MTPDRIEPLSPVTTVVVARDAGLTAQTIGHTPGLLPNVLVKVMSPLAVIVVRSARVFLQTLVGLLMAGSTGMATNTLPAGDFFHLLQVCAGLSVASAVICALQNTIELMTKLDQTKPELRG